MRRSCACGCGEVADTPPYRYASEKCRPPEGQCNCGCKKPVDPDSPFARGQIYAEKNCRKRAAWRRKMGRRANEPLGAHPCRLCDETFQPVKKTQRYCTPVCRASAAEIRRKEECIRNALKAASAALGRANLHAGTLRAVDPTAFGAELRGVAQSLEAFRAWLL